MKHAASTLIAVIVLTVVLAPAAPAQKSKQPSQASETPQVNTVTPTSSMTVWQARKAVVTGLKAVVRRYISYFRFVSVAGSNVTMHPESIRMSAGRIECTADISDWDRDHENLNPRTASCDIDLKSIGTQKVVVAGSIKIGKQTVQYYSLGGILGYFRWGTQDEAQAFADAVNRLSAAAQGRDRELLEADWREFQQKAASWRTLAVKPAISEDVRKHRLLAENAVKERQFDSAVEEYETGLEIDPVWPEGHFNAALLCAELGYYSEAMHHMRAYLELVPEAADAQQSRDQMVIWEAKLKQ